MAYSQEYDKLGVNLTSGGAFVNIVEHTNRYQNVVSFDEKGWPQSDFEMVIMDNRPVAEWEGRIDDPDEYRVDYSGTYECSFKGQAIVESIWSDSNIENIRYDEQTNTTYFELVIPSPSENHSFTYLTFTNTKRLPEGENNTGITDLKVMRPGYDLDTDKIFTDEYLELCRAADFVCYRFYNTQNIWMGEPEFPQKTIWENRKTPEDACQLPMTNMNGKRDAWCWEYIIKLANILNKDIWLNIRISCDSNYVRELAKMLKNDLNESINIYVENSNEVWAADWNTHGPYNQAQADYFGIGFNENYARRTVELSDIFAQVFGKDAINDRIRIILAGQQAYSERSDIHLNYIDKNIGEPRKYIYATSTALYFRSEYPQGSIEEILEGMHEDIYSQINDPNDASYRHNHLEKASVWELPGGCTSYEGGPHIPSGGNLENLDNQILVHRTEEMGNILIKNYTDAWFDIGGGLACYFTLWSGYNRYGCWGLTDDYTKPYRNHKMQAIRNMIGEWEETGVYEFRKRQAKISYGNYPDPFSVSTEIFFSISDLAEVKIELYDVYGNRIEKLYDGIMLPGEHSINFSPEKNSSAIYFYKIRINNELYTGKCIYLK